MCLFSFLLDVDTDEIETDTKNVDEEVIEFFIKEETTIID